MAFSGTGVVPNRSKMRSPAPPRKSPGPCARICSSPVFTRSPSRAEGEFKRPCTKLLPSPKTSDLKENGHHGVPRRSPIPEKASRIGSSRWSSVGTRPSSMASPKRILGEHNETAVLGAKKSRKEWQIPDPCAVQLKESLSGVASPIETGGEAVESFPVVSEVIGRPKEELGLEPRTAMKKLPAVAKKLFVAGVEASSTMTHDQVLSTRAGEGLQERSAVKHSVVFIESSQHLLPAPVVKDIQRETPSPASQHSSSGSSTADAAQEEEQQSTESTLSGSCGWKPASEYLLKESAQSVKAEELTSTSALDEQQEATGGDQEATAVEQEATGAEAEVEAEEEAAVFEPRKERNGCRVIRSISSWCLLVGLFVGLTFLAASYVSRGTGLHQLWIDGCKHQALFFAADEFWSSEQDLVGLYVHPEQLCANAKNLAAEVYTGMQDRLQSLHPRYKKLKSSLLSFVEIAVPLAKDTASSLRHQFGRWYLLSKESVSQLEHIAYKALVEEYLGHEEPTRTEDQLLDVEDDKAESIGEIAEEEMNAAYSKLQDDDPSHKEPDAGTPVALETVELDYNKAEDAEGPMEASLHSDEEGSTPAVLQMVELDYEKMEDAERSPAPRETSLLSNEGVAGTTKENLLVKVEGPRQKSEVEVKGLDTREGAGNLETGSARLGPYFISAALVVGALGLYAIYPKQLQKKRSAKRQQRVSPRAEIFRSVEPVRQNKYYGTPEQLRLFGADDDLVITPEQASESPYGSFTAFKQVVMNEGSGREQVKLTPVRRSNRIRNQLLSCKQ